MGGVGDLLCYTIVSIVRDQDKGKGFKWWFYFSSFEGGSKRIFSSPFSMGCFGRFFQTERPETSEGSAEAIMPRAQSRVCAVSKL